MAAEMGAAGALAGVPPGGPAHCPVWLIAKGESHMSQVFSIDTPDTTVSAPVLAFIRNTR